MADFAFDEKLSPRENITRFLAHLDTVDADMAALLRANIGTMIPLPTGSDRSNRRVEFNRHIIAALDALPDPSGGAPA